MALNRRPDLLRRAKSRAGGGGDEQSPAGRAAKTIERILTTCLQDRTTDRYTKPAGKKVAVYVFINLELKLLFAVRASSRFFPAQEKHFHCCVSFLY